MVTKNYLFVLFLVILIFLVSCKTQNEVLDNIGADQNLQDVNTEQETSQDRAETESQSTENQNEETPDFSFPANYCPLTTEMVKKYCDIDFELALDRENCAVASANGEGQALMFFPINIRTEYSNYGVSNFRDFIEADIEATKEMNSGEGEFCNVKSFTLDNLGDEAIVTSGVLVKTTPNSCADSNAENPEDLTLFGLNVRKGENNIAILEGGGSVFSASNSERCSLEEVETLVRVELLGEEIEAPEEETPASAIIRSYVRVCPNMYDLYFGNKIKAIGERIFNDRYVKGANGFEAVDFYNAEVYAFGVSAAGTEAYNKTCLSTPHYGDCYTGCRINTTWEEYKRNKLNQMGGFNEVQGPRLESIQNYFYLAQLGWVYLYFQNPNDNSVYLVVIDGRNVNTQYYNDGTMGLSRRLELAVNLQKEIFPLLNNYEKVVVV